MSFTDIEPYSDAEQWKHNTFNSLSFQTICDLNDFSSVLFSFVILKIPHTYNIEITYDIKVHAKKEIKLNSK